MRFASILMALGCLLSIAGAQSYGRTIQAQTAPSPVRVVLEQMSPAERKNSCISVEFESSDDEDVALGREVERLWNGGQYDEALAQLGNLEARIGTGRVAIGNSWRKPVPTLETDLWGRDVRIGNRDSLVEVAFDMDTKDSSLFVALRHGSRPPHYSVCMSTDSGATWAETFTWVGSPPTYLDVGAVSNYYLSYLYVAYNSPGENAQQVRLRRFLSSDGSAATFPTGVMWIAPCTLAVGDTMKEVSLIGTLLGYSGGPYLVTLVSDGSVLFSYHYSSDVMLWSTMPTGVDSGASHGLDATRNQDCRTTPFFSYCGTDDSIRIYSRSSSVFTQRFSHFAGPGTLTSISARHDRIICAFEDETSSPHQVRYVVNPDNGDTWTMGTLSDSSVAANAPAVISRGGDGFAAVFRHCAPTRELRFRQCTDSGPWSDPVSIAANEPYWNRPAIEYLGAGVFGVVYLSDSGPVVRGAYFDRSDWPYGLTEQRRLMMGRNVLNVIPNPLSGPGRLNYTLNRPADLRVQVYDRAGRIVRTLFHGPSPAGRQSLGFDATGMAPGVYFIRADVDGRALTVPMTVVK